MPGAKYLLPLLGLLLAAAPGAAATRIDVTYADPSRFIDAGRWEGPREQARTLGVLTAYLQKLGDRYLDADEALNIEILDLDLAGRIEPWHLDSHDVRIMRDIDWPVIRLRYTLTRNGDVVSSGEERIADQNYLWSATALNTGDRLRFKKRMLDNWFHKHFAG